MAEEEVEEDLKDNHQEAIDHKQKEIVEEEEEELSVEEAQDKEAKEFKEKELMKINLFMLVNIFFRFLIFPGNLNWDTTELTLGRHFEIYGDIKNVKIIEDNQGRSKGFGYVEFEKKEIAS